MSIKIIDGHFYTGPVPEQYVDDRMLETTLRVMDHLDIERAISANSYMFIGHQFEQCPMLGVVYGAQISDLEKEKILRHNALRVFFHEE